MKAEHINAFLDPAVFVIKKMLNTEATVGQIITGSQDNLKDSLSILVGMKGDLSGAIILSFSLDTAKKIAANMLKRETVSELEQDEKAALSELANMIVGNATGRLYEMGLKENLTPPTIVMGMQVSFSIPQVNKSVVVPINTDLGLLDINIFLKDDRNV